MQVVIRVRPPLPRELQGFTEYQCTSMVDARSGQLITISENLPAVLSGQGASDGMLYATYRCAQNMQLSTFMLLFPWREFTLWLKKSAGDALALGQLHHNQHMAARH